MKLTSKLAMLSSIVVVLACGSLLAAPLCAPGTMADYVALGATGCEIGDKVFYNWSYVGTGYGGGVAPPASGIGVVPLTAPSWNPGFRFAAGWYAGAGQVIDSLIIYSVRVNPGGAGIRDISALMGGYGSFGAGSGVIVTETTAPNVGTLLLYHYAGGTKASDVVYFSPTMGPIEVTKDITLVGGAGFAVLSRVENRFSQIPEPLTMVLIGSGLLGLGLLRRRLHKA